MAINLDISKLNTSNALFMTGKFSYSISLSYLDLTNFDMNNVKDMSRLFSKCQ